MGTCMGTRKLIVLSTGISIIIYGTMWKIKAKIISVRFILVFTDVAFI